MNAVIYARYSSDKQTEQSIEGQLRVCHEFAERNGYKIINEYIDRAISGTSDRRPAFLKMIDDAKKKEFQFIIVYKLDRFSRSKYDSVFYKHELAKYGVKVISATEAISDSPEGRLVEGLLEMMSEMFIQDLKQKVKRGIRENLLKNNTIGGKMTYGYKVIDKKYVIDEERAPAIKYLFEQYAKGKTKKKIFEELNSKGYRNFNGKPFTKSSLQGALSNTKYIGKYVHDDLVLDNYCPAIIDEDLFYKVQGMLKFNKKTGAKNKAKEEFLLTGKCFCGYCGSNVVGISGTSRNGTIHHYYACTKQYKQHACKKRYENKGYLEWYVVEQARLKVLQPELHEKIVNRVYEAMQQNETELKIKNYKDRIRKVDAEIDKCFDMYMSATTQLLKNKADQKAKDLEVLRDDLQSELKKLELSKTIMKTKEEIAAMLKFFMKGDELDVEYQRRIIKTFINAVYLYDDEIGIYFDLIDQQQVSFVDFATDIEEINITGEYLDESGTFVQISNVNGHQYQPNPIRRVRFFY